MFNIAITKFMNISLTDIWGFTVSAKPKPLIRTSRFYFKRGCGMIKRDIFLAPK
jgi:hypothetical protein